MRSLTVIVFTLLWMSLFAPMRPVITHANDVMPLTGTINDDTPVYEVPITITESNSTIWADLHASSGDLDPLLYLLDADGNILAENDDRVKGNKDPLLVYANADPGDYLLLATRYKATQGKSSGDFELTVTVEPPQITLLNYDVSPERLAASGFPVSDPLPEAEWVILAYYGADTSLESGILNDFNEFELAGGSTSEVRIVVLMDRIDGFTDADGDWIETRLFEVAPDQSADQDQTYPPTVDTVELADLGEFDMGEGQTFAEFLTWGITHYPAQHYAIALGSHGAGWQGLITDDTDEHDILSLPELRVALETVQTTTGVEGFDLLINDACLMSSVEYLTTMASFFELTYASPEIVVDPALDMTQFVTLLHSGEDLTQAGIQLVNTYIERDVDPESSSSVFMTHAVTDLTAYPAVMDAVEAFAVLAQSDPARTMFWIGEARANTYTYTAFMRGVKYIDLGDFMRLVIEQSDDEDFDAAAQAVLDALHTANLYGSAGESAATKTSYYNIYFPQRSKDFELDYLEQSPLIEWGKMLRSYYNSVTPRVFTADNTVRLDAGLSGESPVESTPEVTAIPTFHAPVVPRVNLSSVYPQQAADTYTQVNIQMEVFGRHVANGTFTADYRQADGTSQRLYVSPIYSEVTIDGEVDWINQWDSGVDVGTFVWDVRLPVISDGDVEANEFITDTEKVAALDGRVRLPDSTTWNDVSVLFDEYGDVQRVVSEAEGSNALGTMRVPVGADFQAYREIVTPDGRTIREPGTLYSWPPGGLTLYWDPAPTGTYDLGILVETFGGTTGFDEVQVEVNTDTVYYDVSGYTELDWGFNFLYVDTWMPPVFYEDEYESYIYSFNEDETADLVVLLFETDSTDPEDIAWEFLDSDWTIDYYDELFPLVVGGVDGVEFEFDYENDFGDVVPASGFAVYNPHTELPLIFFIAGDYDDADAQEAWELLLDHTTFFFVEDTRQWTTDYVTLYDYFPVLNAWFEGAVETMDGFRYMPPDGTEDVWADVGLFDVAGDDLATIHEQAVGERLPAAFVIDETRPYQAERYAWVVTLYHGTRADRDITGRLYTTLTGDGAVVVMQFEAPTDQAPRFFADVFELMVDGFNYTVPE